MQTWQQLRDAAVEMKKKIKPLTTGQSKYFQAIHSSIITICSGCAGVGKTFIPCGLAAQMLREDKINKIIITRPLIQCRSKGNDGLGILPGELEDKIGPYVRPIMDAFEEFFTPAELKGYIRDKVIEVIPLEVMRGSSLKDCFIICDEAQNTTFSQLHMLLTRIGNNTKMVIAGDVSQSDLDGSNALAETIKRLRDMNDVSIVGLGREDVVRSKIVAELDRRMTDDENNYYEVELGLWNHYKCPCCQKIVWYNEESPLVKYVEFVQCWHCQKDSFIPEKNNEPIVLSDKINTMTKVKGQKRP